MSKSQRIKGAVYERELAIEFRASGFSARRAGFQQSQDASSEADVIVEGLPFWFEAKRGSRGAHPYPALKQALVVCGDRVPVFVGRPDKEPSIVAMYFEDFLKLLEKAYPEAKSHHSLFDRRDNDTTSVSADQNPRPQDSANPASKSDGMVLDAGTRRDPGDASGTR